MAKAYYYGHNASMEAFENMRPKDNPYYSVWIGPNMYYQYNEDDREEGSQKLSAILQAGEDQRNRDVLIIKFHPALDGGYITNKTKIIGQLPVCAYNPREDNEDDVVVAGARPGNVSNAVWGKLTSIENMMSANMEERIKALELAKEQPAAVSGFSWPEQIGSLLSQPGAVETIGTVIQPLVATLANILGNFIPNQPPAVSPNLAIGHIEQKSKAPAGDHIAQNGGAGSEEYTEEENQIIDEAISKLSDYCNPVVCFPKLAEVAEKNPVLFKSMLDTLMQM